MAYDSLEPIGGIRMDFAAGVIASTVANVNRRRVGDRKYTPKDFMPFLHEQKQKLSPEAAAAVFRAMAGKR